MSIKERACAQMVRKVGPGWYGSCFSVLVKTVIQMEDDMNREMKTTHGKVAASATVLLLATGALAVADVPIRINSIDPAPLSAAEEAGILFMREEEKLARDVYLALNEIWQLRVFEKIA